MKVLILGIDGYLGHALKCHLSDHGHEVVGFDNRLRRQMVKNVGSDSIYPISHDEPIGDARDYGALEYFGKGVGAVVHFAEQPSAPYSLRSRGDAMSTQENNIVGTLNVVWWLRQHPEVHLLKLGTMGVYGTPEGDIPEHNEAVAYDPGSFYHISKAADSINIRKACQWWGLKATDVHQGVVYGHVHETRMDYDSYFGTIVNRFVAQAAVGYPLTIYGNGGQTRGFINIRETLQCMQWAIENPPDGYRVFNQFTEVFSVEQIADMVARETSCSVQRVKNPRFEKEQHYYNPAHVRVPEMGIKLFPMAKEIPFLFDKAVKYRSRIKQEVIMPKTTWA